jgi:hypothetical protein
VSRVGNPFANFRIARDGGEKTTAKRDSSEAVKSIHGESLIQENMQAVKR